jgi:hypothetical protein
MLGGVFKNGGVCMGHGIQPNINRSCIADNGGREELAARIHEIEAVAMWDELSVKLRLLLNTRGTIKPYRKAERNRKSRTEQLCCRGVAVAAQCKISRRCKRGYAEAGGRCPPKGPKTSTYTSARSLPLTSPAPVDHPGQTPTSSNF